MADDLKVTPDDVQRNRNQKDHQDLAHALESNTRGSGLFHDAASLYKDIDGGNWAQGLLDTVGAAGSIAKFADPLSALYAAGAGYLMEHVSFLKEPLDWLTGDQDAIKAASQTWGNVAEELNKAGQQLSDHVQKDTAPWKGPAIDAYKPVATAHAELVSATSMAAKGASAMVSMCGTVLKVVRDIVRDLISKAVGDILACITEWAAAELLSAGLATPGLVGDVVRRATSWASRIMTWVRKVTGIFKKAKGLIQKIKDLLQKVGDKLGETKVGKAANNIGESKAGQMYKTAKKPFDDVERPWARPRRHTFAKSPGYDEVSGEMKQAHSKVEWPKVDQDQVARHSTNEFSKKFRTEAKEYGAEQVDGSSDDDSDQQQ